MRIKKQREGSRCFFVLLRDLFKRFGGKRVALHKLPFAVSRLSYRGDCCTAVVLELWSLEFFDGLYSIKGSCVACVIDNLRRFNGTLEVVSLEKLCCYNFILFITREDSSIVDISPSRSSLLVYSILATNTALMASSSAFGTVTAAVKAPSGRL